MPLAARAMPTPAATASKRPTAMMDQAIPEWHRRRSAREETHWDAYDKEQKAFDNDEDHKSLVEVTGQAVSASRRGIRNMRASIAGRDEPEQSPAPSNPPPAGLASHEPLPDLPGENAPAIPLSAAEPPSVPSAGAIPAESAAPPEHKSRVKSIARNTYRCVRSLFRRCREQTEGAN